MCPRFLCVSQGTVVLSQEATKTEKLVGVGDNLIRVEKNTQFVLL